MQTLISQYGQSDMTLPSATPTVALRWILARTHVGTPNREIIREVRRRITKLGGYTRAQARDTLRAALWIHEENRRAYSAAMGGH